MNEVDTPKCTMTKMYNYNNMFAVQENMWAKLTYLTSPLQSTIMVSETLEGSQLGYVLVIH